MCCSCCANACATAQTIASNWRFVHPPNLSRGRSGSHAGVRGGEGLVGTSGVGGPGAAGASGATGAQNAAAASTPPARPPTTTPPSSPSPSWPAARKPTGASSPNGALTKAPAPPIPAGSSSPKEVTTSIPDVTIAWLPASPGSLPALWSGGPSSPCTPPPASPAAAHMDSDLTTSVRSRSSAGVGRSSPAGPRALSPRDGDPFGSPVSTFAGWSGVHCLPLRGLTANSRLVASVPSRTSSTSSFTLTPARPSSRVARAATLSWSCCPWTTASASPAFNPASTLAAGVSSTALAILTPIFTFPQCLRAAVPRVLSMPSRGQRRRRCGSISRFSKWCLRAQPRPTCLYSLLRSNSCATNGQNSGGWYFNHSLNCFTAVEFTKVLNVTCQTRMGLSP
mmetsp:Transcript_15504/g.39229  ORF Transcript_15504/g.39229 Transcript_15504/m.39229 type:complete len:395 (+) Transcript_15504:104-1288(+)